MGQEFSLIDRYFRPLSQGLSQDEIGIGDDGAVLTPPPKHQLVVVTDTLVAGVHFPEHATADDIAWKAVAVNLSDLAAMGAKPNSFTLGLTLPEHNEAWLHDFAQGLKAICQRYRVPLVGGDTTKGPLTLTVTANGWVPTGTALLRSGAKEGDKIAVTGELGDAGLGLKIALNRLSHTEQAWLDEPHKNYTALLLSALNRPQPQLEIGQRLIGLASSAIDVSDGLLADLGHILECSNQLNESLTDELAAEVELGQLPLSDAMQHWFRQRPEWTLPLAAGDDYQLCFTVPPKNWDGVVRLAEQLGVKVTEIGRMKRAAQAKRGIYFSDRSREVFADDSAYDAFLQTIKQSGYQHF
ncbi:thiamine-phosphate kinase [Thiomicrorhabdus sp. zzn3]|uniref:thiamine-phosphate kinase n=1 Tax=Thiomicrorhabdus sp. zzn3 TaxID=3039775 RepID=UPI002437116A|nr:thiamine-phosphate kinase [Thiomicrorhabdus sp. zzn3]MDG6777777.1 thiamine-phosphate kinase [Thiomicrorhabdus sp. zzn3]